MKKIDRLSDIVKRLIWVSMGKRKRFLTSEEYWKNRYKSGGNSGAGSYLEFAKFKAAILNQFVRDHDVNSVIEFGCGDGNQLTLSEYPAYIGFDVSSDAIDLCRKTFSNDASKQFRLVQDYKGETAKLSMSLDVIYHLVEDEVFKQYMRTLFDSSSKYIIIYSSNCNEQVKFQSPHVKHRRFSDWIDENLSGWHLKEQIPNEYSLEIIGQADGSSADFFIYEHD